MRNHDRSLGGLAGLADPRRSRTGIAARLLPVILILFLIATATPVSGQLSPSYSELFQDPLPAVRLTPADLPNLGRLVSLEATSMFVHAREEFFDTGVSRRLLSDVGDVWIAADAFTAAVSFDPRDSRRVEAGILAFPDLMNAFGRLRQSVDMIPGQFYQTVRHFWDMSRVISVIGPVLREAYQDAEIAAPLPPLPGDLSDLRDRTRVLIAAIAGLNRSLAGMNPGDAAPRELKGQLAVLDQLAQGFDAVLSGGPDERATVPSFRPLRSLSSRIDARVTPSSFPAPFRAEWKNVLAQIDELSELFRLPRVIVTSAGGPSPSRKENDALKAIDTALDELDSAMVGSEPRVPPAPGVEEGVSGLRLRLLVLRQQVAGGEPSPVISATLATIESARRRLGDRLNQPAGERASTLTASMKKVDDALATIRVQLPRGR